MKTKEDFLDNIIKGRLLPLFYHADLPVCYAVATALYKGGARCLEFTNRGERALENFAALVRWRNENFPDLIMAVGTIKNRKDAAAFLDAGADVLISPFYDAGVQEIAAKKNVLWIPGCMTPTEIHVAVTAGSKLIKLFPGNVLGAGFVEAIKPLFPGTQFVVTGGVDTSNENITSWLKSGAVGVGLGSKLISKTVLEQEQYEVLEAETTKVVDLLNAWK